MLTFYAVPVFIIGAKKLNILPNKTKRHVIAGAKKATKKTLIGADYLI